MQQKDKVIHTLVGVVKARAGHEDCLNLPEWDDDCWKHLLAGSKVMVLENGGILLERDDPSSDLYFLVEGSLQVSIPHADGMTLNGPVTRYPGSIIGEIAFLDGGTRTASVWSRGRSILLHLPASEFQSFMAAEPKLACDVLCAIGRIVAERLRQCTGASPHGRARRAGPSEY
ncbi:MAG: cyclic nucleotide-binding domain-containing protein [Sedimenticolaceae bacterium]